MARITNQMVMDQLNDLKNDHISVKQEVNDETGSMNTILYIRIDDEDHKIEYRIDLDKLVELGIASKQIH